MTDDKNSCQMAPNTQSVQKDRYSLGQTIASYYFNLNDMDFVGKSSYFHSAKLMTKQSGTQRLAHPQAISHLSGTQMQVKG